ncbi:MULTISPECIES: TSUP family transporter [unclassified Streptomyces]|uniref:TSUP family transporter n=1 Tax=unclassified Streptomyces TaxID=2593676 RepID=UPI002E78B7D4|nr:MULTISPECIES: TSUP family transporter [unclassified Streptomyces]MEE1757971.1 TSUP family transporter [Streptomyces sp. SP18BB07]MEE1832861.1 TSUP family transporter [Streptomyces sp. SP17KL33]
MDPEIVAALLVAATAAGWVDAVVGGGGLILIPTLLVAFPGMAPATVLGTNKLTAITGTSVAAVTYARRTKLDRSVALSAAGLAVPSAGIGALSASSLPADWFRPLIMALLIGVAAFVTLRPSFGSVIETADAVSGRRRLMAIGVAGCGVGFYDGVFGPGTGTFLIMSFTALLSMEFLQSSALAKIVNVGTNFGALTVFAVQGHVLWTLGAGMAVCNIVGATLGARTALKRGSGFIRGVLLVVVTVLVIKLAVDQFG